jgi:hypothetical protein
MTRSFTMADVSNYKPRISGARRGLEYLEP